MFAAIADLAFPSACLGCGRAGSVLCAACRPPEGARRRLIFDGLVVWSAARYADPVRAAIMRFKRGRRDAARDLEAFFGERLADRVPAGAILVPVPTLLARGRERGFDQSVRLARACGAASGAPVLLALEQTRRDAQRGRSRAARLRACGRFRCTAPAVVRGVQAVLVDDVVTTGATLLDCAEALAAHGALVRQALVLADA